MLLRQLGRPGAVARVDRRRVRHVAETLDLRAEQHALGFHLQAAVEPETVEQLEAKRVQDGQEGGVGIVGDGLAQRQRPVRRELGHQAIRERPDALVLLVALRGGMATGEDGPREVADAPLGLAARAVLARVLLAFLAVACRHRLLVLRAHIAALDVQGAVAVDADEDAGTRDLRRIVDDGALLERRQRRLDLAQARVDLLGDLLGVGVLLLQLVELRLEGIARRGSPSSSAAPPCR